MSTVLETDGYCLSCGYNLRGLAGDPIRCPECGNHNWLRSLEVRPNEVAKHVTYMTTMIEKSAASASTLLTIAFFTAFVRGPGGVILLCVAGGVFSVVVNTVRFRGLCRGTGGWLRGFAGLHLLNLAAAIVAVISAVGFVLVTIATVDWVQSRYGMFSEFVVAFVLLAILTFVIVVFQVRRRVYRPMSREILESIGPLRPEVAERLVRLEQRDARIRGRSRTIEK